MAWYRPSLHTPPSPYPDLEDCEEGRLVGVVAPMTRQQHVAMNESFEVLAYLRDQETCILN